LAGRDPDRRGRARAPPPPRRPYGRTEGLQRALARAAAPPRMGSTVEDGVRPGTRSTPVFSIVVTRIAATSRMAASPSRASRRSNATANSSAPAVTAGGWSAIPASPASALTTGLSRHSPRRSAASTSSRSASFRALRSFGMRATTLDL
jgi:hypothetical protein